MKNFYLCIQPMPIGEASFAPEFAHQNGVAPGLYYVNNSDNSNLYLVSSTFTNTLFIYGEANKIILNQQIDLDAIKQQAKLEGKLEGITEANKSITVNSTEKPEEQKFTMQEMLKTIAIVINPQPLATAVAKNELNVEVITNGN